MKALIVYDSTYGNTEQIARAIGAAISGEIKVLRVSEVNPSDMNSIDLLILGSPTQGARPTVAMQEFLNKIDVKGKNVAVFDTRIGIAKLFGVAADKIVKSLKEKGAIAIAPTAGFNVTAEKVPKLKEGELERAASWAKTLIK